MKGRLSLECTTCGTLYVVEWEDGMRVPPGGFVYMVCPRCPVVMRTAAVESGREVVGAHNVEVVADLRSVIEQVDAERAAEAQHVAEKQAADAETRWARWRSQHRGGSM